MAELKLRLEKYGPNSLIFIEGNRNIDNFYIIKSGEVITTRIHDVTEDQNQNQNVLKAGDTFGVVSCLSVRPRIDSAKTLTAVEAISIKREQFIPLIQNNTAIALKILRSFSRKLRDFDASITRLALKKPVSENTSKIAEIGQYYFQRKKYKQAWYCFNRFQALNPGNTTAPGLAGNIKKIQDLGIDLTPFKQEVDFTRTYHDKSMLFCEHEPGEELFIVQKGRVQISKIIGDKELLLAVLNPGDVIGEMAIIENKPRNASAIAFGDVTVLVVNKANFLNMVQSNPQVVYKILTLLSERIWVAYRQLENLAIKDDFKRLLDAIMIQLEKQKVNFESQGEFNLGLAPADLLRLIGVGEEREDELIEKLLSDKNFRLMDNNLMIGNLEELVKVVESIRKFQLSIQEKKG